MNKILLLFGIVLTSLLTSCTVPTKEITYLPVYKQVVNTCTEPSIRPRKDLLNGHTDLARFILLLEYLTELNLYLDEVQNYIICLESKMGSK